MAANKFQDKVAIITGSSVGIGKATAIELVKNGASVVLNGRNQERLTKAENEIKALGGKVLAVCCDVSVPGQAKNLVDKTIETFGKLDILINNAGVSMRGDFADLSPDVYKTVFDINLLGSVNPTIPAMKRIIIIVGLILLILQICRRFWLIQK